MYITQLRYAVKVIEVQNFSKAAEQLFISQPTLSQQIRKLEEFLNVTLFIRSTRSFEMTEAGKVFYQKAKTALDAIDEMEAAMKEFPSTEKRKLRIGLLPTLSKMGLTKKIANFMDYNKNIEIEFTEDYSENLLLMILNHKLDVALVNRIVFYKKEEEKLLDYINLSSDKIVIIAGKHHRFSENKPVDIRLLSEESLIKLPDKSSVTKLIRSEFEENSVKANVVYECKNISTLIDMVGEGMGISFLSSKVAEKYKTDNIKIVPLIPDIITTTAIVALKTKKEPPFLKKFYDELTRH